jgi:hypothetical protein
MPAEVPRAAGAPSSISWRNPMSHHDVKEKAGKKAATTKKAATKK